MEDLNQNPTEEIGLFDDYEENSTEELDKTDTVDDDANEDNHIEEAVQESTENDDAFITVKFNKQDRNLSKEEAINLAQKGLNYDRIYPNYEKMNKNYGQFESVHGKINELAERNGMSIDDYLDSLSNMQREFAVSQELQALQAQYPDVDKDVLNELAQSRADHKLSQAQAKAAQQNEQMADARRDDIEKQLIKFEKHYPDVDAASLDDSVYAMMDEGYTLLEAYNEFLSKQNSLKDTEKIRQEEVAQKNLTNKKKSLGNIGTNGSSEKDDFLSGFLD